MYAQSTLRTSHTTNFNHSTKGKQVSQLSQVHTKQVNIQAALNMQMSKKFSSHDNCSHDSTTCFWAIVSNSNYASLHFSRIFKGYLQFGQTSAIRI